MIGLIIKDLLNIRKELKIYVLFIAVYVAITFVSQDTNILMAVIAMMCVMMPLTAMAYDEKVNWDKYSLTMPISRREIVLSKYVLGVGLATMGLIITSIISIFDNGIITDFLQLPVVYWCISIVLLSIILPIIIKFGAEKGRFIMIAVMFLPTFLIVLLSKVIPMDNITRIIDSLFNYATIIAIVSIVVSLTLSIAISTKIYESKEL
ncbi:MAG: ABC-2 transporter permease [Peptostreptococcaceae bacterium]